MKTYKQNIKLLFLSMLVFILSPLAQAQSVYEELIARRLVSPINPEIPRAELRYGDSDSAYRHYYAIPMRLARLEAARSSAAGLIGSEDVHDAWAEDNFFKAQGEVERLRIFNNLPMDPSTPQEKTFLGTVFGQLWAAARTILSIQFKITDNAFLEAKAELIRAINNDLAFDGRATREQVRVAVINYKAALHMAIFNHVSTTESNIGDKLMNLDKHVQMLEQTLQVFKNQKNNSSYLLLSAIIAADELMFREVRSLLYDRTRKRLQIFNDWMADLRKRSAANRLGNSCLKLFN